MPESLIVITGGPGAGKSTLLDHLHQHHGLSVVEEGGRAIIREQLARGGDALPWANRVAFCQAMFEHALTTRQRALAAGGPWLFDRGLPDVLGYARLCGLPIPEALVTAARELRYGRTVFLAPAWEAIYHNDAERRQDFIEAQRTAVVMAEVYEELGYRVVRLPLADLTERAAFVLEALGTAHHAH
ncbi:AAA family ATPase [Pseudomonas nitroreducens]|uniref:AAA family ATPase n=1 Tax=Pseudomonas nitroreducens TaxID=46680 RepID=UPI001FB66235|nr:AAA family ATPase [Pseudomonas nitroreducens]MCJ1879864.1 ATP-binding protein [Pseudomonas nitroreducens]MCJ1895032.1 ATP-binding protein [Pseudomonas nitroreducens]